MGFLRRTKLCNLKSDDDDDDDDDGGGGGGGGGQPISQLLAHQFGLRVVGTKVELLLCLRGSHHERPGDMWASPDNAAPMLSSSMRSR